MTSLLGRAMLLAKPTPTKSFAYAHGGDGGGGVPEHAEAERLRAHEHASSGIWAALLAHADELIECRRRAIIALIGGSSDLPAACRASVRPGISC